MREIKFRLRNGKKVVGYERWGGLEWEQSEDGEKWFASCFIPHQDKDRFTGLKDRTGKEIYEGDIINRPVDVTDWNKKHFNITNDSMEMALIVWDEENACFDERFHPHQKMHPCFEVVRLADVEMEVEIIGNIYETPELLQERTV